LVLKRNKVFFRPSNIITASIGAGLLWIGWYGFNGGSAVVANSGAALAITTTHMAGCVSGLVWVILFWAHNRKFSLVASLGGGIAGLAGITPASGLISTQWSLFVGFLIGIATFYAAIGFKRIGVDDALDVVAIHGVSGIIGSMSIGFFGDKRQNMFGQDGWVNGHPIQIAYQLLGVTVAMVWSGFWTFAILKGLDLVIGIRVSKTVERLGLDLCEHGEFADDTAFMRNKKYAKEHPDLFPRAEREAHHSESSSHDEAAGDHKLQNLDKSIDERSKVESQQELSK